jgi:WD40 repeat protein
VNFSSDGRRIISGSGDDTVRIWDADTEVPPALQGHAGDVLTVAFSPDGKRVVSGSDDQTLCVWDAISGIKISAMRGHGSGVLSVNFSPDGRRVVSGSSDKTVRVWDATSGAQVFPEFRGHTNIVQKVIFSPNGSCIISRSFSEFLSWDAASGHRLQSIGLFDGSYADSIHFCAEGWVEDAVTNKRLSKLPTIISKSCNETHGRSLAIGTQNGRVFVMDFPPALFTSPDARYACEVENIDVNGGEIRIGDHSYDEDWVTVDFIGEADDVPDWTMTQRVDYLSD